MLLWVLLTGLIVAGCAGVNPSFGEVPADNSERTVDKTTLAEAGVWSIVTLGAYEQDCILTADVTADVNPDYETDPGQDTQDKVFLLSAAEAQELFGIGKMYNDSRKCEATAYAVENHADTSKSGNTFWWLRSPGSITSGSSSSKATYVDTSGQVQTLGEDVDNGRQIAIRPVIWVSIID